MPGFNVPNATDLVAGTIRSLDQAEPDSLDFQVAGNRRNGVVSGADVSSVSSASSNPTPAYLNVTLSACEVVINGVYGSITSGLTVVVPSAPAGADTRFDVICAYNNSGTFQLDVVTGTSSSSNPVFPTIPSSKIPLYAVYVKSGENSTDPAELLIDKRVLMLSSLVRTGTGDPAGTLGGVGDIYLDVSAQTVNTRSGVWVKSDSTTWRRLASYGELTGDVTTVGTAATIANNAVTSAKLNTAVAGNGLSGGGGSALAVNVDGTTIEISSDSLRIKDGGVGPAKLSTGTYAINISGTATNATNATNWWATSHVGTWYLVNNWDGVRWRITSNHGAEVRVGYADIAGSTPASGITGQQGMWTSVNRPGPYRLYRRDGDNAYSVQTRYDGSRWILEGYENDTPHAPCRVGYADSAGSADSASTSGSANYASAAGCLTNGQSNFFPSSGTQPLTVALRSGGDGVLVASYFAGTGTVGVGVGASTNLRRRDSDGYFLIEGSRREYKSNIQELTNALSVVNSLSPVKFKWKKEYAGPDSVNKELQAIIDASYEYGFIVEDVANIDTNLVSYMDDNDTNTPTPRMWQQNGVIALLVKAVQELSAEVEALKAAK